jgi:hypothetical protein
MRNLVSPPPSTHCEQCDGELLLKMIEPGDPLFDTELQIFVCAKCGHQQARKVTHDRYSAHFASKTTGGNMGQGNRGWPAGERPQK